MNSSSVKICSLEQLIKDIAGPLVAGNDLNPCQILWSPSADTEIPNDDVTVTDGGKTYVMDIATDSDYLGNIPDIYVHCPEDRFYCGCIYQLTLLATWRVGAVTHHSEPHLDGDWSDWNNFYFLGNGEDIRLCALVNLLEGERVDKYDDPQNAGTPPPTPNGIPHYIGNMYIAYPRYGGSRGATATYTINTGG